MKTYVKFYLDTPYFGTKGEEFYEYEANTPEELHSMIEVDYEVAVRQHAEQYEHNVTGWYDEEEATDEDFEDYYNDCFGYSSWEFITEKEYLENK